MNIDVNGNGYGVKRHEEECDCECGKKALQDVDVAVGVEIHPDVKFGQIELECQGEPCVSCDCEGCNTGCVLVITQHIKVKIPVKFGINATPGATTVNCKDCKD